MNGMNSTQFDHAHLDLDDERRDVERFDQKTFDLVARAALFILESSGHGQCIFEGFYTSKLDHLAKKKGKVYFNNIFVRCSDVFHFTFENDLYLINNAKHRPRPHFITFGYY